MNSVSVVLRCWTKIDLEYLWLFLLIFDSLFLFAAGNRGSTPPQQGGPTQEQIYAPVAHLQQKIQQRQLQQFHQVWKTNNVQ